MILLRKAVGFRPAKTHCHEVSQLATENEVHFFGMAGLSERVLHSDHLPLTLLPSNDRGFSSDRIDNNDNNKHRFSTYEYLRLSPVNEKLC